MNTTNYYKASPTPRGDLAELSYEGQDPNRKLYKPGFEQFFESIPIIKDDDLLQWISIDKAKRTMRALALKLQQEPWLKENEPARNEFTRTLLAIESPLHVSTMVPSPLDDPRDTSEVDVKDGAEIVIGHWGDGFKTPIHEHTSGFLFEEMLYGKMKINNYRLVGENKVRLIGTTINHRGEGIALNLTEPLIHDFTSIGNSASLHFLPEHARDGRTTKYEVEYFEDTYDLNCRVNQIATLDGMYAQKGDVILVRSINTPDLGGHYILVTGHPVMKEHGFRPQVIIFDSPRNKVLSQHPLNQGLVLLKLNCETRMAFNEFHGIKFINGQVKIG